MALSNRSGTIDGVRMKNPPLYRMEGERVLIRRAIWMGFRLHKWTYEPAPANDEAATAFKAHALGSV